MKELLPRFVRSRPGLLGLAIVFLLIAAAVSAPLLAPRDPLQTSAAAFRAPAVGRLLGTDNLGRDIWSGVVYGARVSLLVGVLAALTSAAVGIAVGALAGYAGGWVDNWLMRVAEMFQTIPQFFLALVAVALIGRGLGKIIIVLGVLGWPLTARLIRAEFLSLKEREFVEAARAIGMPAWRIALRGILPNALSPAIVAASLGVAEAILLEAGLSFFGLGDPNFMSWGLMLQNAQGYLRRAWWMAVFPGLGIFLAVFGFNLLGDGLNDALNPRLRERM
jgi:peptide/nickel transport system permease protein